MGQINEETGILGLAESISKFSESPLTPEQLRKIFVDILMNSEVIQHLSQNVKDNLKEQFTKNELLYPPPLDETPL
jgi:hypothetical protein